MAMGRFLPAGLARALLPERAPSPDYWRVRACDIPVSLAAEVKNALTAQAWLIALGVGDPTAAPLTGVMLNESKALVVRLMGLSIAAAVPVSAITARPRGAYAWACLLAQSVSLLQLVLFFAPDWVIPIAMLSAVLEACIASVWRPALTVVREHLRGGSDAGVRAELARKETNQNHVAWFAKLALKVLTLWLVSSVIGDNVAVMAGAWLVAAATVVCLQLLRLRLLAVPQVSRSALSLLSRALVASPDATVMSPAEAAWAAPVVSIPWSGAGSRTWRYQIGSCVAAVGHTRVLPALAQCQHLPFVLVADPAEARLHVLLKDAHTKADLVMAATTAACLCVRLDLSKQKAWPGVVRSACESALDDWVSARRRLAEAGWQTRSGLFHTAGWTVADRGDGKVVESRTEDDGTVVASTVDLKHPDSGGGGHRKLRFGLGTLWVGLRRFLAKILLPRGYPASVADEYVSFQVYDTAEVACAQLRDAVVAQAGMLAIGVGSAGATALSVIQLETTSTALATVMALAVGGLFRADASRARMKQWILGGKLLAAVHACLGLVSGMWPQHLLAVRLASAAVSSVYTPLAGGAQNALLMHLAADSSDAGFQGDVAAKEANQDAALGLVMMAARWWLLTWLGTSFQRAWVVLVALSVAHVCFATWSVRALALRRLNRDRLQIAADLWDGGVMDDFHPAGVARAERLVTMPAWAASGARWEVEVVATTADTAAAGTRFDLLPDQRTLSVSLAAFPCGDAPVQLAAAFVRHRLGQAVAAGSGARPDLDVCREALSKAVSEVPSFGAALVAAGFSLDASLLS